ncbi:hypothetical protein AGABI2DRAFT_196055 [Agaricus bisporus var. bisporus H97]|uniref:hypothetical protein n=1 Tax=Agaricus bisporus var. bisporus (strain H97 / ATCC MYA-4626 / FGSC 10389) TaxID=936046 RepID=UPI00029F741A|nr:hypothetical protein AGABI2DRAFT_196055 [Agaricus bisporus var. bisporus H97]EKV42010.1 hypothetical protein AGABI2DRAFT_196055 [Agaricus bisporus var. bisporus H97]
MNNMRMLEQTEEDDAADVTWEDQQRISTFSRLNTRVKALEEKLEGIKQQKEALDDLTTELELADEDEPVLYKIGETFLHIPHTRALKRLERDQQEADQQFMQIAGQVEEIESQMKALKVVLYAKFGKAINLEE